MPQKVSVVHTAVAEQPRMTMEFARWDTKDIPDSAFDVRLPPDAKKIDMLRLAQAGRPAAAPAEGK